MGTITIDVKYLDKLTVEVTAVGVTGHSVVVNDHINSPDGHAAAAGPPGTVESTFKAADGKTRKRLTISI